MFESGEVAVKVGHGLERGQAGQFERGITHAKDYFQLPRQGGRFVFPAIFPAGFEFNEGC